MCGERDSLEGEIKDSISRNLLWIEENLIENLTISQGELGVEIGFLTHLTEYTDDFVKDIMEVICPKKK